MNYTDILTVSLIKELSKHIKTIIRILNIKIFI